MYDYFEVYPDESYGKVINLIKYLNDYISCYKNSNNETYFKIKSLMDEIYIYPKNNIILDKKTFYDMMNSSIFEEISLFSSIEFQKIHIKFINTNIRKLELQANNLNEINNIEYLVNLEYLNLSFNKLDSKVLNSALNIQNIKSINLSHNEIENINEDSVINNKSVENIFLSNNKIKSIDIDKILLSTNLKELDLRNNNMEIKLNSDITTYNNNDIKIYLSSSFINYDFTNLLENSNNIVITKDKNPDINHGNIMKRYKKLKKVCLINK